MHSSGNVALFSHLTATLHESAQSVHVTLDSFGAVAAEYSFFPSSRVMYVRWYGHVTGDELVRAAAVGLGINQRFQPLVLMHDTRGTSGDWGEAASWVEYEWIPGIRAHCGQLRGIGFLLDADVPEPYPNVQLLEKLHEQFELQKFYSPQSAWNWIDQRTMHN